MSEQSKETPNSQNLENSNTLLIFGIILGVIGVGLSYYSLTHHLALKFGEAGNFACNINDVLSCDKVAESKYSEIFGIPLGVYGIGFFGGLVALLLTFAFKPSSRLDTLPFYKNMVYTGAGISIILLVISKTMVDALCPTCIAIYVTTFAQVGLVFFKRDEFTDSFNTKNFYNGATYCAVILGLVIGVYQFVKPTSHDNPYRMAHLMKEKAKSGESSTDAPTMLSPKRHDIKISKSAYSGLGEDYRVGSDEAKVIIQEFADFQCPACQKISDTLQLLKREFGDKISIVFRNYPLDKTCNSSIKSKFHDNACEAATIARCAGRLGKFWPLHNRIYASQEDINSENLKKWGMEAGLTEEAITECKASPDILAKIKDDVAVANKIGVNSTPSLYFNGQHFVDNPTYQNLRVQIEQILNK